MKKDINLAIVGSREITNYELLDQIMTDDILPKYEIKKIISGGAKGVDTLAEQWANKHSVELNIYPADWKTYGKSAGYRRNHTIIKNSDFVLILWDGQSKGTMHDIKLSEEYEKSSVIYVIQDNDTIRYVNEYLYEKT